MKFKNFGYHVKFLEEKRENCHIFVRPKKPKKTRMFAVIWPYFVFARIYKKLYWLVFICSLNSKKTNDKIKLKKKILTFYLPTKNEKQTLVTEINKYKIYTKSMNNNFIVQKHAKSSWKVIILPRCHHETTHLCWNAL